MKKCRTFTCPRRTFGRYCDACLKAQSEAALELFRPINQNPPSPDRAGASSRTSPATGSDAVPRRASGATFLEGGVE
ncbi:hypothetical protein B7486_16565 [cyanobacterium TDX16]|nr:hypothetical protein B7486_16565 [cyanobacterium TDX16]